MTAPADPRRDRARRAFAVEELGFAPRDLRPYRTDAPSPDHRPMLNDPRTWLEILGTEACWQLLGEQQVGRLGVVTEGRPEIFPVNYAVDGRTVVFRTERGSKLSALDRSPDVCFEVDSIDAGRRAGWSVVVHGRADVVRSSDELPRLRSLPLQLWTIGDKPTFVRIAPNLVTGRRIHPSAAAG